MLTGNSRNTRTLWDYGDLRIDVHRVILRLPEELAEVATLLMTLNGTEAATRLGISRSTLYRRLMGIRSVFAAAGLDHYLCQPGISARRAVVDAGHCGRNRREHRRAG